MEQDGFVTQYNFKDDAARIAYFDKYNDEYATKEKQLLAGRYRIDTSIDSAKQEKLQIVVDNQLAKYTATNSATGLYKKQGASVTIDNSTGEVVAIVGGRSQAGNTFNRAFLGVRQPGSSIKPLVAYTPAFEKGYIPESEYVDKAIEKDNNGTPPKNDDFIYRGEVSLRYALEISINTIAYRLVGETGVQKSLDYLRNMQFKYITPEDYTPQVAIGGFNKGATPVEMASGYSTLSRNGMFISPTNVRKITNTVIGEVLFENKHEQTKVYDSGASYLTTDALKGVLTNSHSTGRGLSLSNYPYAAGKTGTTDKSKDCWFVGYTPYYTTSVWIGEDIQKPQNMSGASGPGPIWKEYMEYLHQGLEQKDFTRPDTVITRNGVLMDTLYVKLNSGGKLAKTQAQIAKEKAAKIASDAAAKKVIDDAAKVASDAAAAQKAIVDAAAQKVIDDAAAQKVIDDAAVQKAIDDAAAQKAIDDAAAQKAIDDAAAAQKAIDDAAAQ